MCEHPSSLWECSWSQLGEVPMGWVCAISARSVGGSRGNPQSQEGAGPVRILSQSWLCPAGPCRDRTALAMGQSRVPAVPPAVGPRHVQRHGAELRVQARGSVPPSAPDTQRLDPQDTTLKPNICPQWPREPHWAGLGGLSSAPGRAPEGAAGQDRAVGHHGAGTLWLCPCCACPLSP